MDRNVTVTMVGLGYIGLPTAALIASKKIKVTGVDINEKVVEKINQGEIHIIEPDLEGLVKYAVEKQYLTASTQPVASNVYLIAVPTPFKGNHEPDISYVQAAVENIIPFLQKGSLLIIESTSPVGTTEKMHALIREKRPEIVNDIYMAYCPERVLPGKIIFELEQNDRVIGGINEASTEQAINFYRLFVKGTMHPTNARTAEMCKLVENSSRDVNIAFANELSMICEQAGINVWELIALANRHPRVNILTPGPGVGGHCIAVDPWFIVHDFPTEAKLIRAGRDINTYKTEWIIEKIKNEALKFELAHNRKPKVACMGLAFKPDIDDLRESPARYITESLVAAQLNVLCIEPNVEEVSNLSLTPVEEAVDQADIILFLVAHKQFKSIINKIPENKIVKDYCGLIKDTSKFGKGDSKTTPQPHLNNI